MIKAETGNSKPRDNSHKFNISSKLIVTDRVTNEFENFFTLKPVDLNRNLGSSTQIVETLLKDNVPCPVKF